MVGISDAQRIAHQKTHPEIVSGGVGPYFLPDLKGDLTAHKVGVPPLSALFSTGTYQASTDRLGDYLVHACFSQSGGRLDLTQI
jgi:hypothetical protein